MTRPDRTFLRFVIPALACGGGVVLAGLTGNLLCVPIVAGIGFAVALMATPPDPPGNLQTDP